MTDDELLKMVLRAGLLRAALHDGALESAAAKVPLTVMPGLLETLVRSWDAAESAADRLHADFETHRQRSDAVYGNVLRSYERLREEFDRVVDMDALEALRAVEAKLARAERRYDEQVQINVRQAERIAELRHRVKEGP